LQAFKVYYAENYSGFVLEFDSENLEKYFKEIEIGSVNYKNTPNLKLKKLIQLATATKKPRHGMDLQQLVFSKSYFSKYEEWRYEQKYG
tara:strand:+ start:572 stop:838 length:267 start_codon:yes stop_codon:yes gene_type:complete